MIFKSISNKLYDHRKIVKAFDFSYVKYKTKNDLHRYIMPTSGAVLR